MYGIPSSSSFGVSRFAPPHGQALASVVPRSLSQAADRLPHVICIRPFTRGIEAFGCGQCMPCRINLHRIWCTRLMLEASHQPSFFVTLTYAPEHLPKEGLSKIHCQNFLKRLRKSVEPRTVRYFCVGEYGERFGRPHYHLALYGALMPREIVAAWSLGIVDIRLLAKESASYICGYIQKGRLQSSGAVDGRTPEFRLMSRRPGIGALAMAQIADAYRPHLQEDEDVPATVQIERAHRPIGRYLRGVLRNHLDGGSGRMADAGKLQRLFMMATMSDQDREDMRKLQVLNIEKARRAAFRAAAVQRSQRERKKL